MRTELDASTSASSICSSRTAGGPRARSADSSASPPPPPSAASTGSRARLHPRLHGDPRPQANSVDQLEAFAELRFAPGTQVDDIDRAVADLPELVESFTLAGDPDALVRLRVSDVDHLKRVIDRIRRRRGSAKITGTKTLIVLGTSTGPAGA